MKSRLRIKRACKEEKSSLKGFVEMPEPFFLDLGFFRGDLPLQRLPQPVFDVLGNPARLDAFVNPKGFLGGVDDHETIGTFGDVRLQPPL